MTEVESIIESTETIETVKNICSEVLLQVTYRQWKQM